MRGSWQSCSGVSGGLEGSEEDDFGERSELVGVGVQRERRFSTAARGFILATPCLLRMRTPGRRPAGKQLRGQARGGAGRSSSAPAACSAQQLSPLLEHCSKPYPIILLFCKIRPKVELEPNFHQNESCAEFYKLQNIFWCPKLILSGKR